MANKKRPVKKAGSPKKKSLNFDLKKIKKLPMQVNSQQTVYAICATGPTSTYTGLTNTCSDSCGGTNCC
jgi:hypothetical protein